MNKKIIVIFIMMLLISNITFTIGSNNVDSKQCCKNMNNSLKIDNSSDLNFNLKVTYDDIIDQENTDYSGYGKSVFYGQWKAQSFKPSLGIITKVELLIKKVSSYSYNLTVAIRSKLEDDDITSITIKPSTVTEEWVTFDFPDCGINESERYYIVCYSYEELDFDNSYLWCHSDNWLAYINGEPYYTQNQGDKWYDSSHGDLCFKTYGLVNNPPSKPEKPKGPTSGASNTEYTYSTKSIGDPEGDTVFYKWNWGDGNFSEWIGPYNCGEEIRKSYNWSSQGYYNISVKAKDCWDKESEWSDPLVVSMPKQKMYKQIPRILLWLFERFPFLQSCFD